MSAARLQRYRTLLSEFSKSIATFQNSASNFRVLKSVLPRGSNSSPSIQSPIPPTTASATAPHTLYILDSSYNPPSIAHRRLALSALSKSSVAKHPGPYRLLLLFAVLNADKSGVSPAAFPQRLTMMTIFAEDLLSRMSGSVGSAEHGEGEEQYVSVPIDIAVTKAPYYTDKSIAIATASSGFSSQEEVGSAEQQPFYPSNPKHIHLLGYDTLIRFFNPKYYSDSSPPLSAVAPYFDAGYALRATLRPDGAGTSEADSRNEQSAWLQRLEDGELEDVGGKREWAKQIELVPPNKRVGVSSTKVREAAKGQRWEEVKDLCGESVEEWVRSEGLYREEKN